MTTNYIPKFDRCTAFGGEYQDVHDHERAAGRYCIACEPDKALPPMSEEELRKENEMMAWGEARMTCR